MNLEILSSARTVEEYDGWSDDLSALQMVPVTHAVFLSAIDALRELTRRSQRGIALPDILIAAAAQEAGCGVLHYDRHYDVLQQIFDFQSRWIAPKGSIP